MISSFPLLFFFFFFTIVCFLHVHGQLPLPINEQPITDHSVAIQRHEVYIVHVLKSPVRKFHLFKQRKDWYKSFLPNDTLFSSEPRLVYAYRQVITGFAAWLTQGELKAMESMDGFLLAHQNSPLHHRTTYTPEFLGLDRSQGMWYESAYGQGQIIAVIDSGVKPTHPSFSGHDMPPAPTKWNGNCFWGKPICNNKLIGAEGSRLAEPLDTKGHGSHCASIVAGNFVDGANVQGVARGTASGIAPKAHLAVYKNAGSADLLKSIEDAIRGHVDVLSISQGDNPEFYASGIVKGAFAAVTKNIITCVAAPNLGPSESSMDTDAPWMITVGAASTDRRIMAIVKLGDGREFFGESAYQPSNYDSPLLPLIYLFRCSGGELIDNDVIGKIVLCRSTFNNRETGENVKKAGGAAMVILGDDGNTTYAQPHVLPASYVTFYAGQQIKDYSSTPNATAAIIFKGTQFKVQPTPAVAAFSGRGPSRWNGGIIKPDVIAPGVNILAAWPYDIGLNHIGTNLVFSFQSGCSMATPHVAGLAALLKNNHPTWSAAAISSAIMTTAYVTDQEGKPISDQFDGKQANIFARGSGHIDPVAANNPGLIYDIQPNDYIRYLCGSGLFDDKQVNAIIKGNITCSTIRSIKVEELNYPSIAVTISIGDEPNIVSRTVTNVGDAGTMYTVEVEEPKGVNIDVSPTVLNFDEVGEKKSFNITLSFKNYPLPDDEFSEGQLSWVSGKYLVRSPIVVSFVATPRVRKLMHPNSIVLDKDIPSQP